MDGLFVSYAGAVGGGFLSFLSPCVLPLVPAYLCFLGGVSLDQLTAQTGQVEEQGLRFNNQQVFFAALAFVLGFSVVFVSLGASASAISGLILDHKELLGKIAGVVIIFFGLHFIGLLRIPFLNYEARVHLSERPAGLTGAFVIGLAFAFGWTPCIGPVLSAVLSVAAQADSLFYGTTLLGAYALGLGVPFLLAAFAARPFLRWMARARRHMRMIETAIGGLLILTGILFVMNSFEVLSYWLLETFPFFTEIG